MRVCTPPYNSIVKFSYQDLFNLYHCAYMGAIWTRINPQSMAKMEPEPLGKATGAVKKQNRVSDCSLVPFRQP